MNTSRFFIAVGVVFSMALVGCGGAHDPSEDLAEEQSALGEIGCATAGGNPYSGNSRNGKSVTPTACGTTEMFRSPGTTHDNGLTCSNQYIAEVTNIQGRALSVQGVWRYDAMPLPIDNCHGAEIELGTYMRNASTGQWDVHTTKLRGYNFLNWGCIILPDAGQSSPPSLNGSEGYDTLRVAAYAKYTTGTGSMAKITYKVPIGIDIVYPPSPC